jgi:hypothetical protein
VSDLKIFWACVAFAVSFLAFFAWLMVWAIGKDAEFRDACAARGGVYVSQYGSDNLCLAPEMIR